jgi:CTP synthase (UTP-ammonia lyase)
MHMQPTSRPLRAAVIGDFDETSTTHLATNAALQHAGGALGVRVRTTWLPTAELERDLGPLADADVLWCAPGSPYRSLRGALAALRHGRERGVPTLGTCGGSQHMIIEHARNVLGIEDADHAEYDPYASRLLVTALSCSLVGRTMAVTLQPGSRAARACGATRILEQYYCNFGLNPAHREAMEEGGFKVVGVDDEGEARVLELPEHPFYVGTLFVPQTRSTAERPHPLVLAFVQAARVGVS